MILTISGNLGSGKSTICDYLSQKYGFTVYSTGAMHRELAREMGLTTLELNERMKGDHSYDNAIDDEIVRLSEKNTGEDMIFDSRLAFHFARGAFKVFAVIDPTEAARRVHGANRGNVERYDSVDETREKLLERSRVENLRFSEIYGIDNLNLSNYDLIVDTTRSQVPLLAEMIMTHARAWENAPEKKGATLLLSPKSVYPTRPINEVPNECLDRLIEENRSAYVSPPVKVVAHEGFFFLAEGHKRLLAALKNDLPFVEAVMADRCDSGTGFSAEELLRGLASLDKGVLKGYESFGGFTYISRPKAYGSGA